LLRTFSPEYEKLKLFNVYLCFFIDNNGNKENIQLGQWLNYEKNGSKSY